MNKILIKSIFVLVGLSSNTYAEYTVHIPLKHIPIIQKDANIIGSASFDKNIINRGESSTLSWNYKYVDEIEIDGLGKYNAIGSIALNPTITSSYKIKAKNNNDEISQIVTLTVIQAVPTITFNSDNYRIGAGSQAQLSWDVLNAQSVNIDNQIGTNLSIKGNQTVNPVSTTTYTLTANGYEDKTNTKSLTINVVPDSIISSFTSDKTKVTIGDSVLFAWNVNDSEGLELNPYGLIDKSKTSESIVQNTIGDTNYVLKTKSLSGRNNESAGISIHTYGMPTITDYKVNNTKSINVEANDELTFTWNGNNISKYKIDNQEVSGLTTKINAKPDSGTYTYTLVAENEAGKTISDTVSVKVVNAGLISLLNAPAAVYINEPFNINWTTSYLKDIKLSSSTGSGITSDVLVSGNSQTIIPTGSGSYTYTLKGLNEADKEKTKSTNVIVEALPTYSGLNVNGASSISVAPNAVLTFEGVGYSSGATLQGRNSDNTANITLPANASSTVGSTTYYAAATKTVNSVTKYSSPRSVTVTVAATTQCAYNYLTDYSNMDVTTIWKWNNVTVGTTGRTVRELTSNGFKYTQGALKSNVYNSNTRVQQYVYEICRTGV